MRFDRVGRQTDQFDTSLGELGLKLCKSAQFGGADWCIILRVRNQDGPLIANPFVEIDWSCCSFRIEIGGDGAQAKSARLVRFPASWSRSEASLLTALDALLHQKPCLECLIVAFR